MKKQHDEKFFEKQKKILATLELILLIAGVVSIIYIVCLGFGFFANSNEEVYAKLVSALLVLFASLLLIIICQGEWNDGQLEIIMLRLKK